MKDKINDWGLHYNITQTKSKARTRFGNRVNFSVNLCLNCETVYEEKYNEYKDIIITEYHEDFPTIGLKRKLCINCKEKEMCELCGSEESTRRNDNIHVCDECNDKHPVRALDEEEVVSNCCSALFTHPGWPDSDICSDCKEHADIGEDNG